MYFKQTSILQCLLFSLIYTDLSHADEHVARDIDSFFNSASREFTAMSILWYSQVTPTEQDYCRCDFDFCDCCETFERHKICVVLSRPEGGVRGITIGTYVDRERGMDIISSNRKRLLVVRNLTPLIRDADFIYKLYDFILRPVNRVTVSVKLLIRINRIPVFVCDMGTFTLTVPHACEIFFLDDDDSFPPPHPPPTHPTTPHPTPPPSTYVIGPIHNLGCNVECGRNERSSHTGRVFGQTQKVDIAEYPWMVFILGRDDSPHISKTNDGHGCSGVLIHCQWFITAGHCVYLDRTGVSQLDKRVTIGKVDINRPYPKGYHRTISEIILHPKRNYGNSLERDIALVRMSEPIVYDHYSLPICLPNPNQEFVNIMCVISGWGVAHEGQKTFTMELQKADVKIHSHDFCQRQFIMHDSNICAGQANSAAGSGMHNGDDGGPLQCLIEDKWVLVGVFTFSHGTYNRFEKISTTLDWIHETIKKFNQ